MNKYITDILTFSLIFFFFFEGAFFIYEGTGKYKDLVPGKEIYRAIKKSKEKNDSKSLVLGDSVGRQLLDSKDFHSNPNSLASNQGISMAGQYFLLNNYLNTGNSLDSLFILYSPFSLQNNLHQVYTFHYFIKPFKAKEYTSQFSQIVKTQVAKIPWNFMVHEPYIATTKWAPDFEPNDSLDFNLISPITDEYLVKIINLADDNNIGLEIIPVPTKQSKKEVVEKFNLDEIEGKPYESLVRSYLNNIEYVDDKYYVDEVHFVNEVRPILTDYILSKFIRGNENEPLPELE